MKSNGLGDRIKKARLDKHMTMEQLGNRVGIARGTVSRYESGNIKTMTGERIVKFANALGVTVDYLLGIGVTNKHPIEPATVRVLGKISGGQPIYANEDYETRIPSGSITNADFAVQVVGESMTGDGIKDGDYVFIHAQDMVMNNEIAAVVIDDSATLKHFFYYPERDMVVLKGSNPSFEDLIYMGPEINEIRVLGKAVGLQRSL